MKDKKRIVLGDSENSSTDENSDLPIIIKTKLFKPPLRREFVVRHSLLKQLDKSLLQPLTLISAPTGYGKSVAASQWLEMKGVKNLWLSVDKEHNDQSIFLNYIFALLKGEWPQQTFNIEHLLGGAYLSAKIIASELINDIVRLQEHFVLVLDDYHAIEDERIHDIINHVLLYPPGNFHLMILTQSDPPLRLSRLRAQMRLNELRMRDLAFTLEEARQLHSFLAPNTPSNDIKLLVEQAEGWITGITAGLMGLVQGVPFEKVIQALHSGSSVLSKLLDEVIIHGLPRKDQKFLALTCLFDRFSEELLRDMIALMNDSELSERLAGDLIQLSRDRNLFLIPLDPIGEWYRYHHLFRSQIMNRVMEYFKEEMIQKLYKEASSWFHKRNLDEEALKYAILSKDVDFAVYLFDSIRIGFHNTEQFQKLERIIEMFPTHVINEHVELLLSLAILQDHKADYKAMRTYLDYARRILDKGSFRETDFRKLKGQFHCVSAYLPFMQGDFDDTIRHAEIGLDLLPSSEQNYFREYALAYYALAHQAIGKMEKGLKVVLDTLDDPSIKDAYFQGRLYHILTLVLLIAGDAREVRRPGMRLQTLQRPENYPGAWMAGIYAAATSYYISDHLEDVHQFHEDLFKHRFRGRPFGVVHHFMIECLASAALGEWDRIESCMVICKEFVSDLDIPPLKGLLDAFEVELALKRNNLDRAIEFGDIANFNPHPPLWYYYIPQLTEVKLLIARKQEEKGCQLLEKLIAEGKSSHNENLLIQAHSVKAVFLHNRGDHHLALEELMEALRLSKGKNQIRVYTDHGEPMDQLLKEIPEDHSEISQVRNLQLSFRKAKKRRLKRMDITLTSREMEVITLVNKGFKNHEIADKLSVSVDAIKKHLYNTYQKLYVSNRTNAINRARELGLFDSHNRAN